MQKKAACIRGEQCVSVTFKGWLNCAVTHHPTLSSQQIADLAEIAHGRLMAYASESQPNDHIPFRALLRLCAALDRWDLVDIGLEVHRRRTVPFDAVVAGDSLNEAVDVSTVAARVLGEVRDLAKSGSDPHRRAQVRRLLRQIRVEVDQLDVSLDTDRLRSVR